MFTRIKLSAAEFKNALLDIKSIIGKGDSSVLLLFKTTGTSLMICTTAKCTYKNYLDIEEIDGSSVEVSINYKDVTQMLGSTGRVELEFTSYALVVYSNNIEISLPIGYGIMTEPKLPEVEFKEIPVSSYVSGLKSILKIIFLFLNFSSIFLYLTKCADELNIIGPDIPKCVNIISPKSS